MALKGRKPFKTKTGRSNYGGGKGDLRRTARRAYMGLKKKRKVKRKTTKKK